MSQSIILTLKGQSTYELLDSGDGEKLERFGEVVLSRPDPQALWKKMKLNEWKRADAHFSRSGTDAAWNYHSDYNRKTGDAKKWSIDFGGLTMWVKPTAFKHTGIFPEQAMNWDWLREKVTTGIQKKTKNVDTPAKPFEVLNLFGYTGGASLACAQAGAHVVHVDGSKAAITWARENAEASKIADKPIRWILEDARVFVEREVKRGRKYAGILMDPPAFGHGANKELWKIEEDFLPLMELCTQLLEESPTFFLVNGYSAGYSSIAYQNNLLPLKEKFGGKIEMGELVIEETPVAGHDARLLPCGIFARWSL